MSGHVTHLFSYQKMPQRTCLFFNQKNNSESAVMNKQQKYKKRPDCKKLKKIKRRERALAIGFCLALVPAWGREKREPMHPPGPNLFPPVPVTAKGWLCWSQWVLAGTRTPVPNPTSACPHRQALHATSEGTWPSAASPSQAPSPKLCPCAQQGGLRQHRCRQQPNHPTLPTRALFHCKHGWV